MPYSLWLIDSSPDFFVFPNREPTTAHNKKSTLSELVFTIKYPSQTTNDGASAGFQFIKKIQLFLTIVYFLFVFFPLCVPFDFASV